MERMKEMARRWEKQLEANDARGFSSSLQVTLGIHGVTYRSMHMREDWVAVCCGWPMGLGANGSPYRSMQGRLFLVWLAIGRWRWPGSRGASP